jgi:hypothetical protein
MGYLVIRSKRMPIWLSRVLLLGGSGYLIATILNYAGIDFTYHRVLLFPATLGEFWTIGYLLIFGIRPTDEKKMNRLLASKEVGLNCRP